MDPRYRIADPSGIFSPGLVFFQDLIEHNIRAMLARTGGPERLRPHVKTHKCPQVVRLQMDHGLTKFKCATIAEAEMLAQTGARDVLLAYPMVGPNCARMARLAAAFPQCAFSVLVDHPAPTRELSAALAETGAELGAMLDLDVGMHRTGIAPGPAARDLYAALATLPGLRPAGLHVYDGHNHQEPPEERRAAVAQLLETVLTLRRDLDKAGLPVPALVVGGTPTFPAFADLDLPGLECSPGTCVLHDHGYGTRFADMPEFVPAAVVLSRVISRPTPTRVTLDLGYKAIASDPPAGKRCIFLNLPEATPMVQNEEHFALETPHAEKYAPGDVVYAIPTHVCPTSALHKEAYVVRNGQVAGTWPIVARDRVLTY